MLSDRKTVLLIDDEVSMHRILQRRFNNSQKFEIVCTRSVKEALDIIDQREPSVILLDIHLCDGNQDGIDSVHVLRCHGFENVVCMFTADASPQLLFQAALAGADDFVVKNPKLDLEAEVSELIRRHNDLTNTDEEDYDSVYLRSRGLMTHQAELLKKYVQLGSPRVKELATKLEISETTLWKRLSRIREKLDVDCMSQVTYMMASIEMFNARLKKKKRRTPLSSPIKK